MRVLHRVVFIIPIVFTTYTPGYIIFLGVFWVGILSPADRVYYGHMPPKLTPHTSIIREQGSSRVVQFRVTEADRLAIYEAANRSGKKFSAWARDVLVGRARRNLMRAK